MKINNKTNLCIFCNQEVTKGRCKEWDTEAGKVYGWACEGCTGMVHYGEFTTDAIKTDRKKYKKELLQPFRQGQISKEYLDAYPKQAKGMIKEGIITKKQAKQSKEVWKGVI